MKKHKITQQDYLRAHRRASREEEIERHGRAASLRPAVHRSKKTYNRKREKAGLKSRLFSCPSARALYPAACMAS